GGEVAATVEPVVVGEVGRGGAVGPAPGGLVELVGEHADGDGGGARSLRRGVVPARGGNQDDQLLPALGANPAQARRRGAPPDQRAPPGHLGQRDRYLGEELAEPERDDVPNSTASSAC